MNFVVQHVIVNILEKQIEIPPPVFKSILVQTKSYRFTIICWNMNILNYVVNLRSLPPSNDSVEYLEHVKIAIYGNTKIIGNS